MATFVKSIHLTVASITPDDLTESTSVLNPN